MPTVEYDLRFFQAGIAEMESYLLAQDIYWPISVSAPVGKAPYPKLTLGTLLLVQLRLEAFINAPQPQTNYQSLFNQLQGIRMRWNAAWRKKAQMEFRARLNLWRDFLSDYHKDPEAHYDRFSYEVNRRVILHLLYAEADQIPIAQHDLLLALDTQLKAILQPGTFIWDIRLSSSFPPDPYWYLYGNLPSI